MKVGFVTANYPPEANGGTEQVVVALARELRAAGVEVTAISGSDREHDGEDARAERYDGVDVLRLQARRGEFGPTDFVKVRLLGIVTDWLREQRPDVVHVHSFSALGLGITRVCRDLGIPVVVTFHDLWTTCARFFRLPMGGATCPTDTDRKPCVPCIAQTLPMAENELLRALRDRDAQVRAELSAADVFTAPSRTAADAVASSLGFDEPIEVIAHGLLRAIPEDHRATGRAAGPLRIGTFGGLVPEKGLRELVAAACATVAAGHACELHLSGPFYDDAFADELRAVARAGGLPLHEHGRYGPSDPHPARALDLCVFPSKCQETYGLVVEEALAHGVPVVVSNFGALAERSVTPGVVVTGLDALANVLVELVGSPERLAALRSAIPSDLPTIATSAARHLDLYHSLR